MAALMGMLTGIDGGMIRDILVNQTPTVLQADLYAVAVLAAGVAVVIGHYPSFAVMIVGAPCASGSQSGEQGALRSVKPSAARERSGWFWSTAKVFHWEFGWKVPLRVRRRLPKPHSQRSASRGPKAGRGNLPVPDHASGCMAVVHGFSTTSQLYINTASSSGLLCLWSANRR
jgi:hypothetical protein